MMSKRLLKNIVMMVLLLCMTVGLVSTVVAATRISSVSIEVKSNGALEDPTLTLKTANCTITEETDWEELSSSTNYQRIRKVLTIKANEGYEFSSRTVKLTGTGKSNATASVTKVSGVELRVRITYKTLEFFEPDNAWWDSNNAGTAVVSKVEGAKKYRFVLYVDGYEEYDKTTSNTYCDFASRLKRDDIYDSDDVYFEVCAIDSAGNESEYVQSRSFNQWSKLKYPNSNNRPAVTYPSYPSNTPSGSNVWQNGVGYPETAGNWVFSNGYWYFRAPNGQYLTGWIVYKGEWYLLSETYNTSPSGRAFPKGAAYSGTWVYYNSKYYYFYSAGQDGHLEGEMARNRWLAGTNGSNYYVDNNGVWVY